MQNEIMSQGVELMLYGMGTVVTFLALLVVATLLMSAIVRRYFAEPPPASTVQPGSVQVPPKHDAQRMAVISAAIHHHRTKR